MAEFIELITTDNRTVLIHIAQILWLERTSTSKDTTAIFLNNEEHERNGPPSLTINETYESVKKRLTRAAGSSIL